MVFNSYVFLLLFLPVFLAAMGIINKISAARPRYKKLFKSAIIAFSVMFYVPFGVRNFAVLAVSILINAAAGLYLSSDSGRGKSALFRIVFLAALVLVNVIALLFFKFSGIFFPVAVSFYTFNQISYIVDLCRGDTESFELTDYLAYILFFPKILQGPLMGYGEFVKELDKAKKEPFDFERLLRALFLLSMGLFKKVILADTFGRAVDFGYDNLLTLGSLEAVLVAVFYSFQLYFDFSGYCDMAAAVCMMTGFDLPVNFNSPYKAVDIVDFWKRWHITLTGFFTKYVYIPLGGNRKGALRMYVNFMIVFLLSGLWHGSGWTFIVWGAMHGVLYVATRMAGKTKAEAITSSGQLQEKKENGAKLPVLVIKTALTFIYVTAAWVFFRAGTVSDAMTLFKRMVIGGPKRIASGMSACFQLDELWYVIKVTPIMELSFAWDICLWVFLAAGAGIVFFAPNAFEISKKCRIGIKTTILTAILLVWSIVSFAGVSTFLYMNF